MKFIDEAKVFIKSGDGGDGWDDAASFELGLADIFALTPA